jgi:hypothetical protein
VAKMQNKANFLRFQSKNRDGQKNKPIYPVNPVYPVKRTVLQNKPNFLSVALCAALWQEIQNEPKYAFFHSKIKHRTSSMQKTNPFFILKSVQSVKFYALGTVVSILSKQTQLTDNTLRVKYK